MATGVLSQNEQLSYSSVNSSVYTTSMKGSSRRPTPKYTKVGERLRHVIPGHVACSMACGGRACKYENPARWSDQEQAIKGIYSSWVTDNILAMARPSTELIEKYNIIEQFQSYGIKTIINLQRPGEHASCGNTLEPESGFTYLPEAFMEAGIYFYNFGWKDYGVASLTTILDMVKVMTFALQEGKVAIHCHAGLGRTGVLIACFLVFATRMTADQAIIFVRAKRPNSIQTRGQLLCVREFTQFLIPLRNVFSCCEPKAHAVTLSQYLIRQRHLLHGYEARLLKHVPKIIHLVCKLLLDLAENRQVIKEDILKVPDLSAEIEKTVSEMVTMQLDKELMRHVNDASLPFTPSAVTVDFENQDAVFSSEHEFDPLWKRRNVECLQPLTHLKRRLSYSDSDLKRAEFLLEQGETPWTVPTQVLLCCNLKQQHVSHACVQPSPPLDISKEAFVHNAFSFWNQPKCSGLEASRDEGSPLFHRRKIPKEIQRSRTFSSGFSGVHNTGESVTAKVANTPRAPSNLPQKADHCRYDPGSNWRQDPMACGGNYCVPQNCDAAPGAECFVRSESQESSAPPQAMPLSIEARRLLAAKALANLNEFIEEAEIKQKVEMWQKELNSRDGAWERICGERDPFILCGLMWSWVEQLKEPVITQEDVDLLVNNRADASEALSLLEKGQHQTILCILHCIVNLQTIPADVEEAFLAHAIKSFTKINFDSENGPVVYHTLKKIFKHALEEKRKITKEGSEHTS
ncbi:protein tyrosine phosphatase domain-containing protein 1 isoform X1 [Vombatus ursinus]|uniref:Protein tyrosine phosphatase domain-containing protein 1 n=1 Tax=Vombatus ursinus TaxID=29139 RepID=A0A4X2L0Z4_VOMUR|nr:protein tyrosine phosphatase domain-containing protein 1 isoform X1 [Vombatus ursinus]XP_027692715.1 protein tyrosine phosphatase domain-containing protein 1 isoform X1 [Vombatus ursinus]XP_027692716.1 protein tyrosine phosphatase domain-containing protein 1 isoform X1 [Vombatus ursinus]